MMNGTAISCRITIIPSVEDVRTAQDIEVPKGPAEKTLVSCPDYIRDVSIHKQPVYRGAFKMMADRGIKFTSYTVTDGAGRPMREEEE